MKIYEIGTGYTPIPATVAAATESVVEELTKAFIKQNIDCEIIDVCASLRAPHNLPINEVKVPGLFTKSDVSLGIVHKVKRVVYSIALSGYLKKILKATKDRVVLHFHNQYNLFFFLKLLPQKLIKKAFIVYTNHNGMWSLPYEEVKTVLKKRYFQEIAAMKGSDLIFALNSNMRDSIINNLGIDENKVVQVANGVNTQIYRPVSKEEIQSAKEKFNLGKKNIILQVGSVYENKGQARSIELLAPVLKENKNIVYAYVGGIVSQEYFEQVKNTAEKLGIQEQVVYLGTTSPGQEMNILYNIADATIFSSQYEGFPLVCIESLCSATPVIITSEHIELFADGCVKATSKDIETVVNDIIENNEEYAKRSREDAQKKFSWSEIAAMHYDYFTSL